MPLVTHLYGAENVAEVGLELLHDPALKIISAQDAGVPGAPGGDVPEIGGKDDHLRACARHVFETGNHLHPEKCYNQR